MRTKRSHKSATPGGKSAGFAVRIVAGGRWRAGDPARALYEDYLRRLPWQVTLTEIEVRGGDPGRRLSDESAKQLAIAAEPPGRVLIALDERGRNIASTEFAQRIRRWQEDGRPALVFAIGGADGLAASVREAADLVLSFGSMTWPHLLARAMLAEQLYRASAILSGHPYHRD